MKNYQAVIVNDPQSPCKLNITLNLAAYCSLVLEHAKLQDKCLSDDKLESYLQEERTSLWDFVSGIDAELLWAQVERQLGAPLFVDETTRNFIQTLIQFNEEKPQAHALLCLKRYFIELFKNSIDNFIWGCLHKNTNLGSLIFSIEIVHIAIAKQDTKALIDNDWSTVHSYPEKFATRLIISDNAGGFSDEYLKAFDPLSCTEQKRSYKRSKKSNYFFGGAGLGMQMLCDFLLSGITQEEISGASYRAYAVVPGSTSIQLSNSSEGAIISLSSPTKGFSKLELNNGSISIVKSPASCTLSAPPPGRFFIKKRKILKASQITADKHEPLQKETAYRLSL